MQVVLDDLPRCQGQPLRNTNICELGCLKNLEEDDILGSRILHVVTISLWNVTYIPCCEVKRSRSSWSLKNCDAGGALQEISPLIRGGVPVDLAHGSGLDNHQGRGEHLCNGERARIQNLDGTTRGQEGCLLGPVVCV